MYEVQLFYYSYYYSYLLLNYYCSISSSLLNLLEKDNGLHMAPMS